MSLLNDYCAGCGRQTLRQQSLSLIKCMVCAKEFFLNPTPVVVALVTNPARSVLLTRRNIEPMKGMFCLPSGFHVVGETAVEAVSRELLEETGIDIHHSYFNLVSNLTTPDTKRVLMFYTASYDGKLSLDTSLFIPNEEVSELRWSEKENLLSVEHAFPLHLMMCEKILGS